MLRGFSWLCTQELLLAVLRGPHGMPRIKSRLATCKAKCPPHCTTTPAPTSIGFSRFHDSCLWDSEEAWNWLKDQTASHRRPFLLHFLLLSFPHNVPWGLLGTHLWVLQAHVSLDQCSPSQSGPGGALVETERTLSVKWFTQLQKNCETNPLRSEGTRPNRCLQGHVTCDPFLKMTHFHTVQRLSVIIWYISSVFSAYICVCVCVFFNKWDYILLFFDLWWYWV